MLILTDTLLLVNMRRKNFAVVVFVFTLKCMKSSPTSIEIFETMPLNTRLVSFSHQDDKGYNTDQTLLTGKHGRASLPSEILNELSDSHKVKQNNSQHYSKTHKLGKMPKLKTKGLELNINKESLRFEGASQMIGKNKHNVEKREVDRNEREYDGSEQEPNSLDYVKDSHSKELNGDKTSKNPIPPLSSQTSAEHAKSTQNEDSYQNTISKSPDNNRNPLSRRRNRRRQVVENPCYTPNEVQSQSHTEYYDGGVSKRQEVPEPKNQDIQGAESKVSPQVEKINGTTEATTKTATEIISQSTITLQPSYNTSRSNSTVNPPAGAKSTNWKRVLEIVGSVTCVFTLIGGAFYMFSSVM